MLELVDEAAAAPATGPWRPRARRAGSPRDPRSAPRARRRRGRRRGDRRRRTRRARPRAAPGARGGGRPRPRARRPDPPDRRPGRAGPQDRVHPHPPRRSPPSVEPTPSWAATSSGRSTPAPGAPTGRPSRSTGRPDASRTRHPTSRHILTRAVLRSQAARSWRSPMSIDEARLEEFIDQFAGDFGAALHASTVVIGDKLGLYRALADLGPTDAATLAAATGCDARLVQEWLDAQYVSGYCHYSAQTGTYWLSPEQAAVLADPTSPAFLVGSMTIAASTAKDEEKIRDAFRPARASAGTSTTTTCSTAPSGCSSPATSPTSSRSGSRRSTASPRRSPTAAPSPTSAAGTAPRRSCWPRPTRRRRSPASTTTRRRSTSPASAPPRPASPTASASRSPPRRTSPATGYDLVCIFDALHDMGDPPERGTHIREALAAGRDVAAGRADGRRAPRRQREPGRADLLRRVHVHLHPGGAGPDRAATRSAPRCPRRRSPSSPPPPASAGSAAPRRRRSTASSKLRPVGPNPRTKEKQHGRTRDQRLLGARRGPQPRPHAPSRSSRSPAARSAATRSSPAGAGPSTSSRSSAPTRARPTTSATSCRAPCDVQSDDGSSGEVTPGSCTASPPGHDGWVVGDEPVVVVEFQGAATYAKH